MILILIMPIIEQLHQLFQTDIILQQPTLVLDDKIGLLLLQVVVVIVLVVLIKRQQCNSHI
jgi:hypothetical protein